MGYWGYEATESDSALDAMFKVIALLEKMWDEATDYGEKMAVVYVLTEAPQVDGADYRGLKAKAVAFVADCMTRLDKEDVDDSGSIGDYCEDFNKRYEQITYLQGLIEKLQVKQGTSLGEKLTDCFGSLELTNHEKRSIERFPKQTRGELAEVDKSTSL
tara:strand:+ start:1126 stop:1602 length:477 start_codon:yes stop_codon:yes gene_type:complete